MLDIKEANKLQELKDSMIKEEVKHINKIDANIDRVNGVKDGKLQMDIKRGDMLFVNLTGGIGSEQNNDRFAICIQNDVANKYSPTIIVAFVTSKLTKAKLPVHTEIPAGNFGLPKDSVVLCEQLRTLDKRRIISKVGHVDELTLKKVDNAIDISIKTLAPKSLLKRLSKDMQNYIITTLKDVHEYEITVEKMRYMNMGKSSIDIMVKEKLALLNRFMQYCRQNQLDYEAFYKLNQGVDKEVLEMSMDL